MSWTNDYIGIPWLDGGRTQEGCDCYGLVRLVLGKEFGLNLDAHDQFYTLTNETAAISARITQTTEESWEKVTTTPQAGHVALFTIKGLPIHCGVMINKAEMLNIRKGAQAVIEPIHGLLWGKRLEGIYRYG